MKLNNQKEFKGKPVYLLHEEDFQVRSGFQENDLELISHTFNCQENHTERHYKELLASVSLARCSEKRKACLSS